MKFIHCFSEELKDKLQHLSLITTYKINNLKRIVL